MDNNYLENKNITYSIYFGEKDKDLWQWAASIPNGRFSMIIKDTVRAFNDKNKDFKLPTYKSSEKVNKSFRRNFGVGKADYDIYIFLNNIEKNMVSYRIKEVIRHYLNNNKLETETIERLNIDNSILSTYNHSIENNNIEDHESDLDDLQNTILSFANNKRRK